MAHLRWPLAALVAVTATLAAPEQPMANPQNGTVVGGAQNATITQGGNLTTINQSQDRVIINWQSFNIDNGQTTQFVQPNSGAIALNRVTGGGGGSTIDGALTANGGVWLINPSGVLIGSTANIDVHSLLATTADILDDDFMNGTFTNGRFAFSTPSADTDASIVNKGTITVGNTGLAALVAPHVRNEGTITGQLATVILGGAKTVTLDFNGDGLVQFDASSQVTTTPAGAGALVENTGAIRTPGGTVVLTAVAAANVVDQVINSGGVVEAQGVSLHDGRIVFDGGTEGRIVVDGTLDVSPGEAGARAGSIDIEGHRVVIDHNASLDASDPAGGGSISMKAEDTIGINAAISQTGDTDIALESESVVIRRPIETAGTVSIRAKHVHTEQTGMVTAAGLDLASSAGANHVGGGGHVALKTDVRTLAIGKAQPSDVSFGDVLIDNQGDLTVGLIDSAGIEVGSLLLTTTGTLTLDRPVASSNVGDSLVLAADRFVNQAGSGALQTPGRWLVYSRDPADDDRGGLNGTSVYGRTYAGNPPATIPTPGNTFVYAQAAPPLPPPSVPIPEQDLAAATIPINTEPLIEVNSPLATASFAIDPPRLITVAPPAGDARGEDPLFASDGNRELWDLSSGR